MSRAAEGRRTEPRAATGTWSTPREWVQLWIYGFLAYTVFVVLSGSGSVGYAAGHGQSVDWGYLIKYRMLEEYTCALFVPPLFWLTHRYPVDRMHWRRSVGILFAATLGLTALKYTIYRPLAQLVLGRTDPLVTVFAENAGAVLFDFWAVIGVAQAVEFYRRAQERERIAIRLKAELSQAQLEALRSQLHPHFLFNTLNGVATLMHRDVDAADQMVTDLADLLRATLQQPPSHEIPLADELALVDRYLAIVRVRFGDRLTVAFEIAADVRDTLVPQFLLQPLVENALEHGIAERPGPARLEIRAVREEGTLRIAVTDDGVGLGRAGTGRHGVGLANTRARLAELYGAAQSLVLEPVSGAGGARATVTIPYRTRATPEALGASAGTSFAPSPTVAGDAEPRPALAPA